MVTSLYKYYLLGSGDRKGRKGTGRGESAAGKGIGKKFFLINKKKKERETAARIFIK